MEMIWIWLAVVAISLIIEFITMDLTSIWFSLAGLISLILSAIPGIAWEIQLVVFIVLSALLVIFVRNLTKKFLLRNSNEKTNVDSFIGKRTRLLSPITLSSVGTISINGVVWNVVTEDGTEIEEGKVVEVLRVEGNKLVVKPFVGVVEKEHKTTETKEKTTKK